MALPTKQQIRDLMGKVRDFALKVVSDDPRLASILGDGGSELVNHYDLDDGKMDVFFEEKAYQKKQSKLISLIAMAKGQQQKTQQKLQAALQQLQVAFFITKKRLSFESADAILPFKQDAFDFKERNPTGIRI